MTEPERFIDSAPPWGIPTGPLGGAEGTRPTRVDVCGQDFSNLLSEIRKSAKTYALMDFRLLTVCMDLQIR